MRAFEVGKLFEEGKTRYEEGTRFSFDQSGGVLLLTYDRPTAKEIEEIRKGDLRLGILKKAGIIFLLFKFGSQPWIDASYTCHLSQPYVFDPVEDNTGYGMMVYLVDASTGILKANRLIGLPTKMSKLFTEYVIEQQEKPFNKINYYNAINDIYRNYSTDDMVRMAETFRLREG